ncbi:MAG: polysaccharide biosynthesis tyrosine autokinase [Phycisphaerales bacterium]|nr:polysaccharide biosynthesis tyrosine autokinase [Phycisphaerales bacterium]MCB9835381.1 polysaccharide biosynthesis tyrosine autokinase [Phycisphaera sp.]
MSTAASTHRPAMPMAARPAAPNPGGSGGPSIDPVKLFKKYFWVLMIACVVGLAVGVGAHLVLAKFFPRYDAKVYFKVLPQQLNAMELASEDRLGREQLERFMSTQAQTMVSDKVLDRALLAPTFRTEAASWIAPFMDGTGAIARADAIRELQEDISARPVPKSEFIVLTMSYKQAKDAAYIARQITQSFMDELNSSSDQLTDEQRESLSKRVLEYENEISLNERARDRIINENQIDSIESSKSEEYAAMQNKVERRGLIQDNITALQSQQLEMQRVMSAPGGVVYPEQIRQAAEDDPIVRQTKAGLQQLLAADRALEKAGLGVNHPSRINVQTQIDGTREELDVLRNSIMQSLFSTQVDTLRQSLMQLRAQEAELLDAIDKDKKRLNELAALQQELKELDRKIERAGERKDEAQAALNNLDDIASRESSNRVQVYQNAKVPDKPAFPDPKIIIPAGFVVFVSLVAGLIVLREMLDQRIKGPADVAMIPRTPVLGMLPMASEDPSRPERPETAFHDRPTGVMAESVRQLRVSIVKRMQEAGHRSLLVVPATPQSGATTFVTNLSEACARADIKTLLIDANLRRPRIHGLFNLEANPGLVDILAGAASIEDAVCSTDNKNLDVLTVGSAEHRMFERIVTEPMGELLTRLEARYDMVIIDTAPAIVAGDAVALANRCGATVLVARAMSEKRGTIARLKNELSDTRAEFLGVMINAVRSSAGGYFRKNIRASHEYQQRGRKAAKA